VTIENEIREERETMILSPQRKYIIRDKVSNFRLPSFDVNDGDEIQLYLFRQSTFFCYVECLEFPIRLGRYFGNQISFSTDLDSKNINPKFVFDGERKEWVLCYGGRVSFTQQDIEDI